MKLLGFGAIEQFPFVEPPEQLISDGYRTLEELARWIDRQGRTDTPGPAAGPAAGGPAHRAHAAGLDGAHCLREMLIIAAALSVQDPRERPLEQLRGLARELGLKPNAEPAKPDAVHRALLSGLISHVARRNERSASFTAARGGEVHVFPGSCLFRKKPQWLVAAEITETTRRWARCVAKIHPQWIEELADHLLKKAYRNSLWDPETQQAMTLMRATLYGMEVVRKRRVPLGPIDPKGARELFIHHALVEGDVAMDAPFFAHNQRILREVRSIESRRRKRDVLIGANVRFAFFDERIPHDVWNGRTFNKWRRKAEQRDPNLLFMTREDLMRHAAADVTPDRYPDHLIVAGVPVPVEYAFAPGDASDGITLRLPLELLDRVSEAQMQWLVPGMLRDLVIELVRGLPKSLRSQLAPVPDHVDAILPRLRFGDGALTRAIQEAVHTQYGYELRDDDWNLGVLPDHLRMNYRVLDEAGAPIIEGRDLHALRIELSAALEDRFARAVRTADPKYQQRDLHDWTFGDLPPSVELQDGSTTILAYPALVARDGRVDLTLQADARTAHALQRDGLRLLFMRAIGGDFRSLLDHLPDMDSLAMLGASLPQATDIRRDLLHFIAQRAFLENEADVRTEAEFRARLHEGWDGIWLVANDAVQRVHAILKSHHELADRLAGRIPSQWGVSVHDIAAQREALLNPGFLTNSPYAWLTHVPRYLHASCLRFDKLRHGGHVRDAQRLSPLLEWQMKYDAARVRAAESGYTHPALTNFFWLLQEYRVWLFAQELGTAISISEKILADQWLRVEA
jgi:ATP-dependent helicase HrpA